MKIETTTRANKIAIFCLLVASIAYHVVLGISSADNNQSLFQSGIRFSTNAVRTTLEPSASQPASLLLK